MKLLLILLLINAKFVEASDGFCPPTAVKSTIKNVCYVFSSSFKNFIEAQFDCIAQNGNLADIDSQFTNNLLRDNGANHPWKDFWIGATLNNVTNNDGQSEIWVWDGQNKFVTFNDWGVKEPSNKGNCAAIRTRDGTWFADNCNVEKYYVCSVPMFMEVCDDDWIYFPITRLCYKTFFDADWFTAEENCMKQGAHLVSIHSFDENSLVHDISHFGNSYCDVEESTIIGLRTVNNDSSGYIWSDKSGGGFALWAANEPNNIKINNCVAMYSNLPNEFPAGYWKAIQCNVQQHKYVCRKPPKNVEIR